MRLVKIVAIGSLLIASSLYAASTAACVACHGKSFEKKAMGKSKIVKDMSKADFITAMKGYKDGSYGGSMKGLMKGQVAKLSDADIEAMAEEVLGGGASASVEPAAATTAVAKKVTASAPVDINAKASDKARIAKEDLGTKKSITESAMGLRTSDLYSESDATPNVTDYSRPAAGSSKRFERAYENAPPMIPHDIEGMLPITTANNSCTGCHMPEVAPSMKATPIPASHFATFRPTTKIGAKGEVMKEGKSVVNTSDLKTVVHKLAKLSGSRYNCSQCHAPQSKGGVAVANTFQGGFSADGKGSSNLLDVINDGVK